MTREEINLKISTARDEWDLVPDEDWFKPGPPYKVAKDWQADKNWPTLLREGPSPGVVWVGSGQWGACLDLSVLTATYSYSHVLGEAVDLAWLKWKGLI